MVPQPPQLPLRQILHAKEQDVKEDNVADDEHNAHGLVPVHYGVHRLAGFVLEGEVYGAVPEDQWHEGEAVPAAVRYRAEEGVVDEHAEEGAGVVHDQICLREGRLELGGGLGVGPEACPEDKGDHNVVDESELIEDCVQLPGKEGVVLLEASALLLELSGDLEVGAVVQAHQEGNGGEPDAPLCQKDYVLEAD